MANDTLINFVNIIKKAIKRYIIVKSDSTHQFLEEFVENLRNNLGRRVLFLSPLSTNINILMPETPHFMAEVEEGLIGLQGLHQDLQGLEEGQLRNIDRLWANLEARVGEFRQLLDKPPKNDASRKTLLSGIIYMSAHKMITLSIYTHAGNVTILEEEYAINQEFQDYTTRLADALDLDEIRSAQLLLEVQEDADFLERSNVASAVMLFHEQREFLLESLRLLLGYSTNPDGDDAVRDELRNFVGAILETKDGPARNGSLYIQKCLVAMIGVERWLVALAERRQGAIALGQTLSDEGDQIIEFQQRSLGQQHEALGAIITHLIKAGQAGVEDFHKLLDHLPKLDRWNSIAVHYVPVITTFASHFGSPEGGGVLRDARTLNTKILDSKDSTPWLLRNFQAATITWWLAEYSGWYLEQPTGSPVQNVNLQEEARTRSESFIQALRDGAFECTLSICSQITPDEWYEPAKHALIELLLRESVPLAQDYVVTSSHFQEMLMEQFETFTDACITNMPDTLRQFKVEEDDQRKRFRTNWQHGAPNTIPEQIFHLERFLVIVSFSYDHRAEAAQAFWADVDSNLYGFLQWASRRQSTPCVGACCEMFRSISGGEYCASSAHRFLLEEGSPISAKIRRSHSLSWSQIFGELNIYTAKIREQPMALRPKIQYGGRPGPDEIDEPESSIMLESYLRLMSHLCCESADVRSWILSQSEFSILEILFYLCNTGVPSSLQACALMVVRALLTDKTIDFGMTVWSMLDQWISGTLSPPPNVNRPPKVNPAAKVEQISFEAIAGSFEKANEFAALLYCLTCPTVQESGLNDQLPFPETLGSTYRMSGIEPYVDFVFDNIFASKTPHFEDSLQARILTWNVLRFATVCLDTFNEDLVVLANNSSVSVDDAMNASSLLSYVQLHPFARVMEWMFNEHVLAALFNAAHQNIDEVARASPNSPLTLSLISSINVMNLIIDLQSTYLDIVRPLIKLNSTGRRQPVSNPSLASFEDSVALNLHLVIDLCLYSGVGNQHLTVSSLRLLAKFASSRKLNTQTTPGLSQRIYGNRLISVVEQDGDILPIARSLTLAMQFDLRELDQGRDAPGWSTKSVILDFLIHCISASPDKPSLAHALLGFSCTGSTVDIDSDSLFANGQSLFHAVLHLVLDYPSGDDVTMQSWCLDLKQKGMQILSTLWSSPLTSVFTLSELRLRDFFFVLFTRQTQIAPDSLWDGRVISDSSFLYSASAKALEQLLWQRCSLMEYSSTEIRLVGAERVPSLKERIFSTLLGLTTTEQGEQVQNMTIFDLRDFIELDVSRSNDHPQLIYLAGIDFNVSIEAGPTKSNGLSDLSLVHEMILLRLNELRKSGLMEDANEAQQADVEASRVLQYFESENNRLNLTSARLQAMKAWADLLTLAIGTSELEPSEKSAFILQALQLITPKLEEYSSTNLREAKVEAKTILALLFQLDFGCFASDGSRAGDVANDRLFQVFRTALRAVNSPGVDMQLREVLYKICYRYLTGMAQASDTPSRYRHGIQALKSTGEKTMDIICDDAYGASGTCRISALLLLDSLGNLAKKDKSNYVIEALAKTNFTQILVETIENIPQELRETNAKGESYPVTWNEPPLT